MEAAFPARASAHSHHLLWRDREREKPDPGRCYAEPRSLKKPTAGLVPPWPPDPAGGAAGVGEELARATIACWHTGGAGGRNKSHGGKGTHVPSSVARLHLHGRRARLHRRVQHRP